MRSRIHPVVLPCEIGDFADEVRRVFLELGRTSGVEALTGECSPAIEIVVDLPGVDRSAIRVIIKGDTVLTAAVAFRFRSRRPCPVLPLTSGSAA